LPFWVKKIDLVILTHAHDDHLAGLLEVLDRYQVEKILFNSTDLKTSLVSAWQDKLRLSGAELTLASDNLEFNFDSACFLRVLSAEKNVNDENDRSIVSLFSCLGRQVFLSGDASYKIESSLPLAKVDFLKVSHHGSNTASSQDFLNQLKASYAIISVGLNNRFKHPSPLALERLQSISGHIFRTDQLGSIIFLSNNKEIILKR